MDDPEIPQMILEGGERWLAAGLDRGLKHNAVLITRWPEQCYELTMPKNSTEWVVNKRDLTTGEIGEFFAAFGAHWGMVINSLVEAGSSDGPRYYRIRRFIKNGNQTRKWSISIDAKNPTTLADGNVKAA